MTIDLSGVKVAAIVPCHNEEATVAKVVLDLKAVIPSITVYVYDNNSTDNTVAEAMVAGACVRREERQGKGNVLRRAFADIDADVYVLIDGDDTYEASALPAMIGSLFSGPYDHVLGVRQINGNGASYRLGHKFGNRAFNVLTSVLFHAPVSDMLSGFRVFSRRFVKSFPAVSRQFETETELTIHMLALRLPQTEYAVGYRERPVGSESKLSTFKDGFKILVMIGHLVRHERPNLFYGFCALVMLVLSLALGIPVVIEFIKTGLVPRFPTAILAASCMVISVLFGVVGVIADAVRRGRHENARLRYLALDPPRCMTKGMK